MAVFYAAIWSYPINILSSNKRKYIIQNNE